MKLRCGLAPAERSAARIKYLESWHDYFAWFPVRVGDNDCRWLETVQRKCTWHSWYDGGDWMSDYRVKE